MLKVHIETTQLGLNFKHTAIPLGQNVRGRNIQKLLDWAKILKEHTGTAQLDPNITTELGHTVKMCCNPTGQKCLRPVHNHPNRPKFKRTYRNRPTRPEC